MTWTPACIETVEAIVRQRRDCDACRRRRRANDPCREHSAAAIGRAINKSRNAVIGWMSRRGDSSKTTPEPGPEADPMPAPASAPETERAPVAKAASGSGPGPGGSDRCATPGCGNPPRRHYNDSLCIGCRRDRLDEALYTTNIDGQRIRKRGFNGIGAR